MDSGLIGVIIGGIIGISGGVLNAIIFHFLERKRRRKSIISTAVTEITAIMEKATRFIEGKSNEEELKSSMPLWSGTLALELGFISIDQAIATRRAVVLDMEMRETSREEKAQQCVEACIYALELLKLGVGKRGALIPV